MNQEGFFSTTQLGTMDSLFMAAYGVGQFVFGRLADMGDPKQILLLGMVSIAALLSLFALLGVLDVRAPALYACIRMTEGFVQASGWTATVGMIGSWFDVGHRGIVMGVWSCCAFTGNILGQLMNAAILEQADLNYRWQLCLSVQAGFVLASAALNLAFLEARPSRAVAEALGIRDHAAADAGGEEDEEARLGGCAAAVAGPAEAPEGLGDGAVKASPLGQSNQQPAAAGGVPGGGWAAWAKDFFLEFFRAWRIPGVAYYAAEYTCLKLVGYSLLFWLPYFLVEGPYGMETPDADRTASLMDVGGITGSVLMGLITDGVSRYAGLPSPVRSPACVAFLCLALVPLGFLRAGPFPLIVLNTLVVFAGILIGGPADATTAAVAVDLGKIPALVGSEKVISTVTGIIDGAGALGAALGQYLVASLSQRYGWGTVFIVLMVFCVLSALCLLPLAIRECREIAVRRRKRA